MGRRSSAPPRVQREWLARRYAEHQSAAITAALLHDLFELGTPPALLHACHRIVEDELVHSRLSAEVAEAAGAAVPTEVPPAPAVIPGHAGAQNAAQRALGVCAAVFCCGESTAVPLFVRMRRGASQPLAVRALQRILRDEGRHRAFGWTLLKHLLAEQGASAVAFLRPRVRSWVTGVAHAYHVPDHGLPASEREWGLISPAEYDAAVADATTRVLVPRFSALGLWGEDAPRRRRRAIRTAGGAG